MLPCVVCNACVLIGKHPVTTALHLCVVYVHALIGGTSKCYDWVDKFKDSVGLDQLTSVCCCGEGNAVIHVVHTRNALRCLCIRAGFEA